MVVLNAEPTEFYPGKLAVGLFIPLDEIGTIPDAH